MILCDHVLNLFKLSLALSYHLHDHVCSRCTRTILHDLSIILSSSHLHDHVCSHVGTILHDLSIILSSSHLHDHVCSHVDLAQEQSA